MWTNSKTIWLILSAILVVIFEALSLAGANLPPVESRIVFGIIIILIGYRTLWNGVKALFFLNFQDINLLLVIALIGAYYIGQYVEAAVLIVLFTLAEKLEDYGLSKSKSALDNLIEQLPKYAYLKGMDEPIDAAQISIGQIIVIKPYHLIPLDGEVVSGQSYVDEAAVTGEPLPRGKSRGDPVFAGTLNKQGVLEVKVSKNVQNSTLAKIQKLTFEAIEHQAKTQKFIERFSFYYTPAIIALSLFMTLYFLASGGPFEKGLSQSLALLVISCPCALVVSGPISFYSAIGNAAAKGVLIKGGRYLEAMAQLKAIAFDKTRTLTVGRPLLTDIIPFGERSAEDLLSCAAGIELFSEHPLSQCIVEAARKRNLTLHPVEKFESVVGMGAKADCLVCDDRHHCIGKLKFILKEHHVPEEVVQQIDKLQNQGKTVIVISTNREIEGILGVADEVRKEAPQVVSQLKKMGIISVLLTGDHKAASEYAAKKTGISIFKSDLLPEEKANEVQELVNKYQTVGMVGDGVNDAPALASAQVGITMADLGSAMAIHTASIVILNEHLSRLPYIIRLGRKVLGMIRVNVVFAVAIKFLFVALALFGASNIAVAVFADVGVTLVVVLNSLRLLKIEIPA